MVHTRLLGGAFARLSLSFLLSLPLAACFHVPQAGLQADVPLVEGSPAAGSLLALLNDPHTDLALLDDTVGLDRRAASALMAVLAGRDGLRGTADDTRLSSLARVDAVPWVGPASLRRMADYALRKGYLPGADQVVGCWDGVTFTVAEAHSTLALVNAVSTTTLDERLSLDERAVRSIVQARPIASIDDLSRLYYVGQSAMLQLKTHAVRSRRFAAVSR